jgi:hypothetical protein
VIFIVRFSVQKDHGGIAVFQVVLLEEFFDVGLLMDKVTIRELFQ